MQNKDNLFSIGEFSKITGVGIHSLRYYDEIGALKPAYVDPRSNYRYYGFEELSRVPGINMCLDAGIRLSEFSSFIDNDSVDYRRIIRDSRAAIDRRIEEFRQQQKDLDRLEQSLSMKDNISAEKCCTVSTGGQSVWLMPLSGDHNSWNESDILVKVSSHASKNGCQIKPACFGLIRFISDNRTEDYAFSAIDTVQDKAKAEPFICVIPSGNYFIQRCRSCSIDAAEKLLQSNDHFSNKHILMSLIVPGNNDEGNFHYAAASCS